MSNIYLWLIQKNINNKIQFLIIMGSNIVKEATLLIVQQLNRVLVSS